jgi:hypothetical protein
VSRLRTLTLAGGAVCVAAQFVRPEVRNEPWLTSQALESRVAVPAPVKAILQRSCYDCHSEETHWPWWSAIAPFSWLLARDVGRARHAMDFSNWDGAPSRGQEKLDGICELATSGEMPPSRYTWIHKGSRLSPGDAEILCTWSHSVRRPSP